MDSYKKVMSERRRPLWEAWDKLREEVDNVMIAMTPTGPQAAGAQAVQALTECTRRLREIIAEFYPEDDDEAV